mmetsp:Transcript_11977/g.30717  ORF Transcript_11977/g.30717 Transcript_11977/m.30717 type:complete len:607 (+) Transcript_11977:995-2815(+)
MTDVAAADFDPTWADDPIFVFGYTMMNRGTSFVTDLRVPTHLVLYMTHTYNIDVLVQSAGRATFMRSELLEANGWVDDDRDGASTNDATAVDVSGGAADDAPSAAGAAAGSAPTAPEAVVRVLLPEADYRVVKAYPTLMAKVDEHLQAGTSLQELFGGDDSPLSQLAGLDALRETSRRFGATRKGYAKGFLGQPEEDTDEANELREQLERFGLPHKDEVIWLDSATNRTWYEYRVRRARKDPDLVGPVTSASDIQLLLHCKDRRFARFDKDWIVLDVDAEYGDRWCRTRHDVLTRYPDAVLHEASGRAGATDGGQVDDGGAAYDADGAELQVGHRVQKIAGARAGRHGTVECIESPGKVKVSGCVVQKSANFRRVCATTAFGADDSAVEDPTDVVGAVLGNLAAEAEEVAAERATVEADGIAADEPMSDAADCHAAGGSAAGIPRTPKRRVVDLTDDTIEPLAKRPRADSSRATPRTRFWHSSQGSAGGPSDADPDGGPSDADPIGSIILFTIIKDFCRRVPLPSTCQKLFHDSAIAEKIASLPDNTRRRLCNEAAHHEHPPTWKDFRKIDQHEIETMIAVSAGAVDEDLPPSEQCDALIRFLCAD